MKDFSKKDANSEYASIRYSIAGKNNYFYIGQGISNFWVYSINETSSLIDGVFKEKYTISSITEDGVVVKWITIKNPNNFEVQHELKQLI